MKGKELLRNLFHGDWNPEEVEVTSASLNEVFRAITQELEDQNACYSEITGGKKVC